MALVDPPSPTAVPAAVAAAVPRPRVMARVGAVEVLAVVFFGVYTAYSLRRHQRFETTGFDLGIFEQIVRGYAERHAPIADLKGPGFNALGDHFHPILMLLAPLYRLYPAPGTLLVAQAALIAVSVVPVGRTAVTVLGRSGGLATAVGYGLAWGLQAAIGFDFHEICFAVPLLAMSLNRLVAGRYAAAVAWAAPLVLVKEDLPGTVAAIGGCVFLRGQRRLGLATMAGGVLAGVVIVKVALPALSPYGAYTYAGQMQPGLDGLGAKLTTLFLLLAPVLFLALRSPLVLVAVPTLAWRFLSDNPAYWGDRFHYNAVLVPVLFLAALDGVRAGWPPQVRTAIGAGCLVVSLALGHDGSLSQVIRPQFWHTDPAVAVATRMIDRIPDGAVVAATNNLAPHLTRRCTVRLLAPGPPAEQTAEWIAADLAEVATLGPRAELAALLDALRQRGYRVVYDDGRFVLLHRPSAGGRR